MKRRLSLLAAAVFLLTASVPSGWASVLPWEQPQRGKDSEAPRSEKRTPLRVPVAPASSNKASAAAASGDQTSAQQTGAPAPEQSWPAEGPEQEPPVERQPAEEQLRPEMLELLNSDVPRDGKVEVKVTLLQDLGEAITADVSWDGESPAVRLHSREEHAFRLSPERHMLHVRADAPPLFNQASATVDLTEGKPHRVEIHVEPRFNGMDIRLQIYRGRWKIFDKNFSAPNP